MNYTFNAEKYEMLKNIFDLEEFFENDREEGLPNSLDFLISTLKRGEISLFAGRPAMLHRILALNLLSFLLKNESDKMLFYSFQSTKDRIINQLISIISGVSFRKIETGQLSESDKLLVSDTIKKINSLPIQIEQKASFLDFDIFLADLNDKIITYGITLLVIDNIQQKLEKNIAVLKELAIKLNIHILLIYDLAESNRHVKGHQRRLKVKDLLGLGFQSNIFNTILSSYRPEYYGLQYWDFNTQLPTKNTLEVNIFQGVEQNSVLLKFDLKSFRIGDL